jgi:hypothetical protein
LEAPEFVVPRTKTPLVDDEDPAPNLEASVNEPKLLELPVVAIVTNSILLILLTIPSLPPAKIPLVEDEQEEKEYLPIIRFPKKEALPVVAIVIKSIDAKAVEKSLPPAITPLVGEAQDAGPSLKDPLATDKSPKSIALLVDAIVT